ncbi:MAG: TIGR02757 family protein, partial [Duncaniella sp.]|nr:TIGR02757 family protein [Duncaniella sp.]
INSPAFIADDPVQFPRRFSSLQDIELVSLLAASIAWGNRKMICRDADRMLALMENRPFEYMMEGEFETIPDNMNIHRTFFGRHLKFFLRGMREIYNRYGSLQNFAEKVRIAEDQAPAWKLVENINGILAQTTPDFKEASRCLPQNLKTTALKRVNMALRWLVRNDGIVDMGVWNVIKPSQLYIPLDVHVGDISRQLGLIDRKQDDRRAVDMLTERLRTFRPSDPTVYDFALFGIGMKL